MEQVSIHPMFLLIIYQRDLTVSLLCFNTSHVSINHYRTYSNRNQIPVSIHPMFLLIPRSNRLSTYLIIPPILGNSTLSAFFYQANHITSISQYKLLFFHAITSFLDKSLTTLPGKILDEQVFPCRFIPFA